MSYPILYSASETNFTSLGLGTLTDALTCEVLEKRNGAYELTMTYPITGLHFSEIEKRCLILAKPNYTDNPQPFRIYRITKPLNGIVTIYAQHISYDLSGYIVPSGISAGNLSAACVSLSSYAHDFTIYNQNEGSATFKTDVPASVRSWLGGKEGSLIDLYGGEWHWDKFLCTLSTERGSNRGVTIRYGKNLTAFNQLMDCSGIYSHVVAYYVDSEGTEVDTFNNPVSTGLVLDTVKTLVLDASSEFDELPTEAQLLTYVSQYIDAHNLTIPLVNIELDFVQLQGLSERVDLCDSCNIEFEQLGVSAVAKCIEVSWDTLKERYVKSVFGMAKSTLADSISNISQEEVDKSMQYTRNLVNSMKTTLELAIDNATETITGNRGGYIVIHDADGDGKPDEILIMDTPDIATATKVWRWNASGLGYSSTGYSGSYGTAITAQGQIVADFITTGTMSANLIRGGTLILGGQDNVNGVLQVLDASGNVIGQWNKDGALITGNVEMVSNRTQCKIGVVDTVDGTNIWGITMSPTSASTMSGNAYINFAIAQNTTQNTGIDIKGIYTGSGIYSGSRILRSRQYDNNSNYYEMNFIQQQYGLCIRSAMNNDAAPHAGIDGFLFECRPTHVRIGNRYWQPVNNDAAFRGLYINNASEDGEDHNSTRVRMQAARYTYVDVTDSTINLYASQTVYMRQTSSVLQFYLTSNTYTSFNTNGVYVTINGTMRQLAYQSSSSKRYKHDIKPLTDHHDLLKLNAVKFTYNDDAPYQYEDMKGKSLSGFIAEDVEEVYPNAVIHDKEGNAESWDERRIIPPMLELIKEQQKTIELMQKQIEELTARVERLEK